MEIVNWSFITSNSLDGEMHPSCVKTLIDNTYQPFKSLSKEMSVSKKGSTYLKCPAHTDFLKNTFIFCAPFDLNIELDKDTDGSVKIYCENISQEVFNTLVDTRFLFKKEASHSLIGIDWLPILTATSSIVVQVFPAFFHFSDFTEKTTVIPGEYDISKWTRPIELVFEVKNNKEKIIIKKGDPLSYIKFRIDDQVRLKEIKVPWEEIKTCNEIRQQDPFRPLKERYSALEEIRANKCPYPHNKN